MCACAREKSIWASSTALRLCWIRRTSNSSTRRRSVCRSSPPEVTSLNLNACICLSTTCFEHAPNISQVCWPFSLVRWSVRTRRQIWSKPTTSESLECGDQRQRLEACHYTSRNIDITTVSHQGCTATRVADGMEKLDFNLKSERNCWCEKHHLPVR